MIIYNSKEMATKYMLKDEVVIEIHSVISIEEMLEMLRKGQEITPEIASITAYAINDGEIITQAEFKSDTSPSRYGYQTTLSTTEIEALEERTEQRNQRQDLFKAFEAFQFNRPFRNFQFHPYEVTKEQLLTQLYAACEIMPTIKNIPEKSIAELRRMSNDGDRLYWNFSDISYNNHLPSRADIEFYESLGDYEKRIINESGVHPAKLLDIAKGIKEKDSGRLFTKADEALASTHDTSWVIHYEKTPGFNTKSQLAQYHSQRDFDLALWFSMELTEVRYAQKIDTLYNLLHLPELIDDSFSLSQFRKSCGDISKEEKRNVEFHYFVKKMFDNRIFPESVLNKSNDAELITDLLKEYQAMFQELLQKNGEDFDFEESDLEEYMNTVYIKPVPTVIKTSERIFKELFHGHAPRVLSEYMFAQFEIRNIKPNQATEAQIREIANAFDQKNVSKIVKYKNPTLFALADKINYNEVKMEHMIALASYVTPAVMSTMIKHGFLNWYQAHKNTNLSELVELLSYQEQINNFDINKTAKDLITDITQAYGKNQCAMMEHRYDYRFADNELAIRGRHIMAQEGKLKMYMLQKDDYRNFTVGYDTDCCQHYGGAGESCVYKLTTDPFAGCVIIERDGVVLAQGFVWTDEVQDTLVFDNVEFADDRKVGQFNSIFAAWCQAMPYRNIHIGVGCNPGMRSWGKQVTYGAVLPTTLSNRHCYTDYRASDGRSLKKDGNLQIGIKTNVKITKSADEPTRWDILARPETSFLLNNFNESIESRLEFARNFLNEQTPDIQMQAVHKNLYAIKFIQNPTEEVQRYVIQQDPKLATLINNPCDAVQNILVDLDPSYIRNVTNPNERMQKKAVQYNGLLLGSIENPSEEVQRLAIKQNGYAIRFVENPTEDMQFLAVNSNPKVVSLLPNPTEQVLKAAIAKDPSVIALIDRPNEAIQLFAVERDPYVINAIEYPSYHAIKKAIKLNGLLIRKFQYTYPHLKETALKQNGFAIQVINNPTEEEYLLAVKQNRSVINFIRNPEVKANILAVMNHHQTQERQERQDEIER